jgi:hypothetical protein
LGTENQQKKMKKCWDFPSNYYKFANYYPLSGRDVCVRKSFCDEFLVRNVQEVTVVHTIARCFQSRGIRPSDNTGGYS